MSRIELAGSRDRGGEPTTRSLEKGQRMKELMLIRHGESTWNRENRFTGWTDVPLNQRGAEDETCPVTDNKPTEDIENL